MQWSSWRSGVVTFATAVLATVTWAQLVDAGAAQAGVPPTGGAQPTYVATTMPAPEEHPIDPVILDAHRSHAPQGGDSAVQVITLEVRRSSNGSN